MAFLLYLPQKMNLKELIRQLAHEVGFELVGFTHPSPPPHLETYLNWVAQGRHAGMAYLASSRAQELRADPARILPGVQSIIVVGMRYFNPARHSTPPTPLHGKVAAYAWGKDYHEITLERLEQIAHRIKTLNGAPLTYRAYTDTGPILERDIAMQAGLGWIGKNTCLISPRHGSYFLLGVLFVDLKIDPDPPFTTDQCGNCRRCIEACPTHCILPDRTIDSSRCISYLTIENKGSIPADLRPALGNQVFGCDICQQVCPWNLRFGKLDGSPHLAPHPEQPFPHLPTELLLTPQQFKEKYQATPLLRSKRRGFLRNLAVALGNTHDPQSIPALLTCLNHEEEPLVRAHVAWALGQIGTPLALKGLHEALQQERDPAVLDEIRAAIQSAQSG